MDTEILIIAVIVAAVLNVIVFLMYGADKKKAVKKEWRTPEKTLILGGLIAPWGAILGMHFFRHKTQKAKFKLNYVFAVLHIAVSAALIVMFGI